MKQNEESLWSHGLRLILKQIAKIPYGSYGDVTRYIRTTKAKEQHTFAIVLFSNRKIETTSTGENYQLRVRSKANVTIIWIGMDVLKPVPPSFRDVCRLHHPMRRSYRFIMLLAHNLACERDVCGTQRRRVGGSSGRLSKQRWGVVYTIARNIVKPHRG
jgi:hypothetical protein